MKKYFKYFFTFTVVSLVLKASALEWEQFNYKNEIYKLYKISNKIFYLQKSQWNGNLDLYKLNSFMQPEPENFNESMCHSFSLELKKKYIDTFEFQYCKTDDSANCKTFIKNLYNKVSTITGETYVQYWRGDINLLSPDKSKQFSNDIKLYVSLNSKFHLSPDDIEFEPDNIPNPYENKKIGYILEAETSYSKAENDSLTYLLSSYIPKFSEIESRFEFFKLSGEINFYNSKTYYHSKVKMHFLNCDLIQKKTSIDVWFNVRKKYTNFLPAGSEPYLTEMWKSVGEKQNTLYETKKSTAFNSAAAAYLGTNIGEHFNINAPTYDNDTKENMMTAMFNVLYDQKNKTIKTFQIDSDLYEKINNQEFKFPTSINFLYSGVILKW